jgi:hypothetical protein
MNQMNPSLKTKYCIHQIFKPNNKTSLPIAGAGYCDICKKSPDNINCKRYFGINISTFEVKEYNNDEM